jgi:hypothetical protein
MERKMEYLRSAIIERKAPSSRQRAGREERELPHE